METTISIIQLNTTARNHLVERIIKSKIFKSINSQWKEVFLKEKYVKIEIEIDG